MTGFQKKLYAFIPRYLHNGLLLMAYRVMSVIGKISKEEIRLHKTENTETLKKAEHLFSPGEFIENQDLWKQVRMGRISNVSQVGCGMLATYNALVALKEKPDHHKIAELIRYYETRGIALGGAFGLDPSSVAGYFRKSGYQVQILKKRSPELMDSLGEQSTAVIVLNYNNAENIMDHLHYVCMTKEEDGTYSIHNSYCKENDVYVKKGGFATLSQAIAHASAKKAQMIWAMGIRYEEQTRE